MKPEAVPEEAVKAVAETLLRHYDSEYDSSHLTWEDFAEQARELLTVAAPLIERRTREQVAAEIIAERAEREQRTPDGRPIAPPARPEHVRIRHERRKQAEEDARIAREGRQGLRGAR